MYKLAHQSLDKAIPDRTTVMNFGHLPDTQAYSHTKAIRYALNQWEGLVAYTRNGRASIDNNTAEHSLRPIALGRKNYLFAGSVAGGQRAAALYSLLSTAKLNDLNPSQYLTAVLKRIGQHPINQIDELLPWNIDLTHTQMTDAL